MYENLKIPVLFANRLWLAIQQETYSCYGIFIPDHRIELIPFLLYVNQHVICIAKGEDCQRVTCLFSKCFVSSAHSQFEPLVLYNHAIFRCHGIHRLNIHSLWSAIFTVCRIWWRSPLQKFMHLFPENIKQHNSLIVIYYTSELSIIISDFILCSVRTFSRLIYSVHHINNSQCAVDTYSHPFSHELHSSQFSFPFYSSLSPILLFLSPTLFILHITIFFPCFHLFLRSYIPFFLCFPLNHSFALYLYSK